MTSKPKLAVLVLDAASPDLLRAWADEGVMPHLAALFRRGLVLPTRGPEGFFVGATWPSFYTGLDPSRHGVYWLDTIIPGSYRQRRSSDADLGRHPALWEVLSRQGRRVLVLDVPLSRPVRGLNGTQVVEWGVHDAAFGFRTEPARLRSHILRAAGAHPVPGSCDAARRSPADYADFTDRLVRGAEARARLTRDLMDREPWDFLIQVFSECHCAGHQMWHLHDSGHPGFDPEASRAAGDPLRRVYRAVDRAIGTILDGMDDGTTVVVGTLHGMAHTCGASLLLDDILERLGAVLPPTGPTEGPRPTVPHAVSTGAIRALYHRLPDSVRGPLYDLRQYVNRHWLRRGTPLPIDPARTRAFHVGLGLGSPFSSIRLNIRGREPLGLLEPGSEVDAFAEVLAEGLLELVDPDNGVPAVRRVIRTRELYDGPIAGDLPDLLVEWNPAFQLGSAVLGRGHRALCRVHSDRIGILQAYNSYCRSGEHRIEGLVVARGPGIPAASLDRIVSTTDLAPTFAAILGHEMPTAGGRVVPELLGR